MNSHDGIATFYNQGGAAGSCGQFNDVSNSLRHLFALKLQVLPLCKSQYPFVLESVEPTQPVFLRLFLSCRYSGGLRLAKPTLWTFELSPGFFELIGVNRIGFIQDHCLVQLLAARPISWPVLRSQNPDHKHWRRPKQFWRRDRHWSHCGRHLSRMWREPSWWENDHD